MNKTIIAAYGGGVNSTAMLIECVKRKIQLTLVLFSDTGAERPNTYTHVENFSQWLRDHGARDITTVKNSGMYSSLEDECLQRKCLPSLAYGFRTCSQKYKIRPQDAFIKSQVWASEMFSRGEKITKFIGFDADEPQRAKDYNDKYFNVRYPLIEWDMGRDECVKAIEDAGLCVPGKSACFFCPASRKEDILQLNRSYPDLARRAIQMEENAENLTSVAGLGRQYAWGNILKQTDMLEDYFPPDMACGCYDG